MNITLDGYLSGLHHDLEWHFRHWSPDMGQRLAVELGRADTILLGRNTYEAMAQYWPMKSIDLLCARDELVMADMMNSYRKLVYSRTLVAAHWNNSSIINGPISKTVHQIKQAPGKDIMVYGSGSLVSALIQQGLVDEYQLWIHPVILGRGISLFSRLKYTSSLQLTGATSFDSGVVLVHYREAS
mgnify:CR=1 FL=1|jgi:Dihydrofolate reductase